MTDDGQLDLRSLFTLSYGLYIVSSCSGERLNGQISNAVMQVTDTPPKIAVAVNKGALTHEFIAESGVFAVTVLEEGTPMEFIGLFGFRSGRDVDKFAKVGHRVGMTGCPVVSEHALARIEARVTCSADCGTHTIFTGEVVDARVTGEGRPMTYAYYREVLRGKTPPTAPTYGASAAAARGESVKPEGPFAVHQKPLGPSVLASLPCRPADEAGLGASLPHAARTVISEGDRKMKKYVCEVCGWIYDPEVGDSNAGIEPGVEFADLPDDYICPVCGAGKDQFVPEE